MSITESESAAPAKFSARQHLIKFLRDKLAFVSDDDSTAELIRKGRAFGSSDGGDDVVAVGNTFISRRNGSTDPLVEYWIGRAQQEERHAREQRHDRQQREIAQRIEHQAAQADQQAAAVTKEELDLWWSNQLLSAIGNNDESAIHPAFTLLFDALAELNAERDKARDKALRREIDNAKTYTDEFVRACLQEMKVRFDELEIVFRTKHQADQERFAEAMQQVQRLAGIEATLAELRAVVDAIKCDLTTNTTAMSKRLDKLETDYWSQRRDDERERAEFSNRLAAVEHVSSNLKHEIVDLADGQQRLDDRCNELQTESQRQHQSDEQQRTELTKLGDRLTTIEHTSGDLKRELNDGGKRLGKLEDAREKDQHQHDEHISGINNKIAGFAEQIADFALELKEVRRDLKRATDMTQEIHAMELRLDERRIAADKAKRGARGEVGPKGPKGDTGPAGKDGHSVVLKTKRWETNDGEFLLREILSDGSRMPAANLRPMIEGNFQPLFERLLPELDQRYESMVEDMIAKAMRRYA